MIKITLTTILLLTTILTGSNTVNTNAATINSNTDLLASEYCTVPKKSRQELLNLSKTDKNMVINIKANIERYKIDLKNEEGNITLHTKRYNQTLEQIEAVQKQIEAKVKNFNEIKNVKITLEEFVPDNMSEFKSVSSKLRKLKFYTGGLSTLSENADRSNLGNILKPLNQTLDTLSSQLLDHLYNSENVVYKNLQMKYNIYVLKSNRNIHLQNIENCKNRIERLQKISKPTPPTKKAFNKKTKRISARSSNVASRLKNSRNLIARIANSKIIG